jgi:hypothetical protein
MTPAMTAAVTAVADFRQVHDDQQLFVFVREAQERCIEIITDRVTAESRATMPVLDLARTRAPGEGWSMPPGNLKASVAARLADDSGGPYGEVLADRVYRFSRKRRHRIRPVIEQALARQVGRPVP